MVDTILAFAGGEANRGKPLRVFDWIKAADLIRRHKPSIAIAGLEEDMEWTAGEIFRDGKIVPAEDTYTYLASTWATPILELDGETFECYIMEEQAEKLGFDSGTYWPDIARDMISDDPE